jgi:cysteine desulfurase
MNNNSRIYLDNAATTRVTEDVVEQMLPFLHTTYGNPSSIHAFGREARKALEAARGQVAAAIGANPEEIYFTAGGTEADNWAIRGAAHQNAAKGRHLITSSIEHHAVLNSFETLEKEGFSVTFLPVSPQGAVSLDALRAAIRPDTTLISIITANNEIGTIEPISEIGRIAREKGILFHTDAVQAAGKVPLDVSAQSVDMLSISGHKFHAPKGVGVLYIKKGVKITPLMYGGAQERVQRPGTENLASIVGMGYALQKAVRSMDETNAKIAALRDRLEAGLLTIPETSLNGDKSSRLSNITNITFRYVEGESILLNLDMHGIAASTGSACASGSLDPSHVMLAIGLSHELAHGTIRFSLSEENHEEEIDRTIEVTREIIARLRAMSPLYKK